MHDESGAQIAPDGSSRSIILADSGGVAAQPQASGDDHPHATHSPTAPEHDRPSATHLPPVPGNNRPGATHLPTAPGYDHPDATPSPPVPEHDRAGACCATAPGHDRPQVTHPPPPGHTQASVTDPPAPGRDHPPVTDPTAPGQGLYDRTFTKEEVQRLVQAATAPLLDEEVRLLQVLIQRVAAIGYDPTPPQGQQEGAPTVRQQQRAALMEKLAVVGRAVDVLQRTLKTRQVLAADSPSELYQLLDEAAAYMEDPPPPDAQPADEHGDQGALPSPPPTFSPL